MYTRLNNVITNAIENAMNNSACDFTNWWKDVFETDVYFETEEDFKDLSDTELEIAKYDWIAGCLDGFVSEVCNLLGIEMYNTHSKYNEIILEEIHDIVKDMLFKRISIKKFEVKAGYYEWNIFCNGEIINSISNGFEEYVKENPTLEDIYEVAMNWTDAVFEDFEDDEYDREDYWEIVKALTHAWANHLCVDYGKDFESSYHKVADAE